MGKQSDRRGGEGSPSDKMTEKRTYSLRPTLSAVQPRHTMRASAHPSSKEPDDTFGRHLALFYQRVMKGEISHSDDEEVQEIIERLKLKDFSRVVGRLSEEEVAVAHYLNEKIKVDDLEYFYSLRGTPCYP